MKNNNLIGKDVDFKKLAYLMKNYTGAEIEAVVKSANAFALNRHHDLMNFTKRVVINKPEKVDM